MGEPIRFLLKRYSAALLLAAALVIAAAGGVVWVLSTPAPRQVEIVVPTPSPLVVQVDGAVNRPGVYELEPGSRTGDAIAAAGGVARDADLTDLNMAARIADGVRLTVPVAGPGPLTAADAAASGQPEPNPSGLIDLNTASRSELESLPGIGEVRANLIIEFRTSTGPITRVDDLLAISGIGESTVDSIKPLVVQN